MIYNHFSALILDIPSILANHYFMIHYMKDFTELILGTLGILELTPKVCIHHKITIRKVNIHSKIVVLATEVDINLHTDFGILG